MGKNQENQNEYYRSLNAKIPLADMVIEEAYKNQINIVKEQQKKIKGTIEEMGIENVSFVNPVPKKGERLVRRKGLVIGFNEIYAGEENREYFNAEIYTKEQNDIYSSVEVCENPLGYIYGVSFRFPKGKDSIVIDSEKGESVPINPENLENKLKEQGLKPSLVRKAQTKYNYEKREEQKETVYQVFFNYAMSEGKIDSFRNLPNETAEEKIKNDFREGIGKTLEEAIDCIVNFKLEKYSKIKIA